MLLSLSLILLVGMSMGWICKKLRFPSLFGMIITGIVLGPYVLDWLDSSILNISAELRRIALVIILTRAGLSLNLNDLKKVGRPAVLMCFIPACFEMAGMIILAPPLLGITYIEAAVLGAVIAAVSPAVIVPKMLMLMQKNYGTKKSIPQMILAAASVDDVFVIVVFYVFTGLAKDGSFELMSIATIPLSILTGIVVGVIVGYLLALFYKKVHIRDTIKMVIFLCIAFLLVTIEDEFSKYVPFSGLIAVMSCGIMVRLRYENVADRLGVKFSKLWVVFEVLLFVLVGAAVNPKYVSKAGISAVVLIFGALLFRMVGVFICLIKTKLCLKERFFCMLAYLPKATVQASIGGIPLAMGLACGDIVLTVAVMAILITAPLGAFLIDLTYKKLLKN